MRGEVLEVSTPTPDRAVRVLQRAQQEGRLPLEEVALYGAEIHVVLPDARKLQASVRRLLEAAEIEVRHMAPIAPTLEDVFISAVKPRV